MFTNVSHGEEHLPTDLTRELLLGVTVDDSVVLVQGPELPEVLAAGLTLQTKQTKQPNDLFMMPEAFQIESKTKSGRTFYMVHTSRLCNPLCDECWVT